MSIFRYKKSLIFLLVSVAVAAGGYFAYQYFQTPWYAFAASDGKEPQIRVSIERDFAYHIGDHIPVSIVIKQKAGTKVDVTDDIAVAGPFEIAEQKPLRRKELEDGSVCYKLDITLQSFEVSPKLEGKLEVGWSAASDSTSQTVVIALGPFHTSNTWDGRKKLQEGDRGMIAPWHLLRAIVPLAVSLLITLYLLVKTVQLYRWIWAIRHPREAALKALDRLWLKIAAGDTNPENYKAIEYIIRGSLHIETLLASEVQAQYRGIASRAQLEKFLELSQVAIYSERKLEANENADLKDVSYSLCKDAFKPLEESYRR